MSAELIIASSKYGFAYPFSLPELTDGYSNSFEALLTDKKTHPSRQIWKSGEMKAVTITLDLAVLNEGPIQTPERLVSVLETFMSMALPPAEVTGIPDVVILSIGSWYRRRAYVRDVTVTAKPPFDIDTGMPLVAEVQLELLPIFNRNPVQGFRFTKV